MFTYHDTTHSMLIVRMRSNNQAFQEISRLKDNELDAFFSGNNTTQNNFQLKPIIFVPLFGGTVATAVRCRGLVI